MRCLLASVAILAAGAPAQHWDIRFVGPTLDLYYGFCLRLDGDGRPVVAYATNTHRLRLATLGPDSLIYEDVPESLTGAVDWVSFDIASDGRQGFIAGWTPPVLIERVGGIWSVDSTGLDGDFAFLSYDASCAPHITYRDRGTAVCLASRADSGWTASHVFTATPGITGYRSLYPARARFTPDGRTWVFLNEDVYFNSQLWWGFLYLFEQVGDTWVADFSAGGSHCSAGQPSIAPSVDDSIFGAYGLWPGATMVVNGHTVDTAGSWFCSVECDRLGRPHLAYTPGDLRYAYRTSRWYTLTVPGVACQVGCDLVLDSAGQPVIAYVYSAGLWLARGVDIVGAEEPGRNPERVSSCVPTHVRGVLRLRSPVANLQSAAVLVDAVGRTAMELQPGANDIRHIAPGVYFVYQPTADSRQLTAVRKVVIQR